MPESGASDQAPVDLGGVDLTTVDATPPNSFLVDAQPLDLRTPDSTTPDLPLLEVALPEPAVSDARDGVEAPGSIDASNTDAASTADGSTSSLTDEALCERQCETVNMLTCPVKGACLDDCRQALRSLCKNTARGLLECMITKTAADYDCDDTGMSQLRRNLCQSQRARLRDCLATGNDPA